MVVFTKHHQNKNKSRTTHTFPPRKHEAKTFPLLCRHLFRESSWIFMKQLAMHMKINLKVIIENISTAAVAV